LLTGCSTKTVSVLSPLPDLPLSHLSHRLCLAHGAVDRASLSVPGHPETARIPNRPVRRETAAVAPEKSGTPTMGGILIVIAILLPTVLCPTRQSLCVAHVSPPRLRRNRLLTTTSKSSTAAASALPPAPSSSAGNRRRSVAMPSIVLTQFKMFSTQ